MGVSSNRTGSTRLVARQVSELMFARWQRWQHMVPHERLATVVVETVLGASIAHLPFRDPESGRWLGLEVADDLARPVTPTAIALSMALPPTTVRRRADELATAGVLVRHARGFRVAPGLFAGEALAQIAAGDVTELMAAFHALAEAGYAPAALAIDRDVGALPPGVVSRLLLAFSLRSLETFAALYKDFTAGTIAGAIVAANIRHITDDPALARRYAGEDAVPPDSERRPIALRELSRMLGFPFETLRRRVAALVAEKLVVWQDDGVVVPTRVLQGERHSEDNLRRQTFFEQMIATLIALRIDAAPR